VPSEYVTVATVGPNDVSRKTPRVTFDVTSRFWPLTVVVFDGDADPIANPLFVFP
jgi:hypothetical protein